MEQSNDLLITHERKCMSDRMISNDPSHNTDSLLNRGRLLANGSIVRPFVMLDIQRVVSVEQIEIKLADSRRKQQTSQNNKYYYYEGYFATQL